MIQVNVGPPQDAGTPHEFWYTRFYSPAAKKLGPIPGAPTGSPDGAAASDAPRTPSQADQEPEAAQPQAAPAKKAKATGKATVASVHDECALLRGQLLSVTSELSDAKASVHDECALLRGRLSSVTSELSDVKARLAKLESQ